MKEFIDKLIERLEEEKSNVPVNRILDDIINDKPKELGQLMAYSKVIKIVNELAEEYGKDTNVSTIDAGELFGNGWITDRVPTKEECGAIARKWFLVTIPQANGYRTTPMQYEYTTIRGKDVSRWLWYGRITKVEPIAWKPLPAPYQPKGEQE